MSFRNAFGIYQVLERALKSSKHPLTCVELFDLEEVRKHAEDVNKVSDYLGHMWRRSKALTPKQQFITRVPAPKGIGAARWAYSWKNPDMGTPAQTPVQRFSQPRLVVASKSEMEQRQADIQASVLSDTPTARVSQLPDGSTVIETLHLTITIKQR